MKFKDEKDIKLFLNAVDKCASDVWIFSKNGDKYNLKSTLSQYIALGAMLMDNSEEFELFCRTREDEIIMLNFFKEHPEINS